MDRAVYYPLNCNVIYFPVGAVIDRLMQDNQKLQAEIVISGEQKHQLQASQSMVSTRKSPTDIGRCFVDTSIMY